MEFVLSFLFSLFACVVYTLGVRASRCDMRNCCIFICASRVPYARARSLPRKVYPICGHYFLLKFEPIKMNEKSKWKCRSPQRATVTARSVMQIRTGKINSNLIMWLPVASFFLFFFCNGIGQISPILYFPISEYEPNWITCCCECTQLSG